MHLSLFKSFIVQVHDSVTEIIMMHCDKAAPLLVEGMEDGEGVVKNVAVLSEVWGIYAKAQEEGISPFLRTQFRPVYR